MIHYILFFIGIGLIGVSLFQLKTNFKNASVGVLDEIKKEKMKLVDSMDNAEAIIGVFNELGERIIQDLDERIHRIESLIALTDEKIENIQDKNMFLQMQDDNPITEKGKSDDDSNRNCNAAYLSHDENKEVLKLFEEGYSPQEIARQLNKGIGEVQLICNLAKR